MLDLEEGVRDLFLDAQRIVIEGIRANYAIAYGSRRAETYEEGYDRKAAYRKRNREKLRAKDRERWRLRGRGRVTT